MDDIFEQLVEYGESRLNSLTSGYNNSAMVAEARATALLAQAQGADLKARKAEERKDRAQAVLTTALYIILGIGSLSAITYLLIWVRQNSK